MSLSPPKFPSAKNLSLIVRQVSAAGVYADRDPEDATEGGNVDFTVAIGVALGVRACIYSCLLTQDEVRHLSSLLSSLTLTPARPSLLHSQVCVKASASKPYTRNDFSFKPVLVCTSKGSPNVVWLAEPKQVTKEVKRLLAQWQAELFPKPYLVAFDAVVEYFLTEFKAGRVGAEFVGHHRVYGLAWPPLDNFDENHAALFAVKELTRIIERYWGAADTLEFVDEDEDDEVLSSGKSSSVPDDDGDAMLVEDEVEAAEDEEYDRSVRALAARALPTPFPRPPRVLPAPARCAAHRAALAKKNECAPSCVLCSTDRSAVEQRGGEDQCGEGGGAGGADGGRGQRDGRGTTAARPRARVRLACAHVTPPLPPPPPATPFAPNCLRPAPPTLLSFNIHNQQRVFERACWEASAFVNARRKWCDADRLVGGERHSMASRYTATFPPPRVPAPHRHLATLVPAAGDCCPARLDWRR